MLLSDDNLDDDEPKIEARFEHETANHQIKAEVHLPPRFAKPLKKNGSGSNIRKSDVYKNKVRDKERQEKKK